MMMMMMMMMIKGKSFLIASCNTLVIVSIIDKNTFECDRIKLKHSFEISWGYVKYNKFVVSQSAIRDAYEVTL